jgi:aspartyl aminopeptidase
VGSESTTGAAGPLLEHVVDELLRVRGIGDERFDFLRKSMCISADNAHGLHPNYPERHDANHAPLVNRGPALKHNANQRYATSAKGAAVMCRIATEAGVSLQDFVSNNAMPCGSTIGPITATRLGIETVDVGVPQLAMHSARETCGSSDPLGLRDLMVAAAKTSAY